MVCDDITADCAAELYVGIRKRAALPKLLWMSIKVSSKAVNFWLSAKCFAAESSATVRLAQATVLLVRMCKDCSSTLFRRSDFAREVAVVPPDQRAFQLLKQFETGIGSLMPRFQKLLIALQYVRMQRGRLRIADLH